VRGPSLLYNRQGGGGGKKRNTGRKGREPLTPPPPFTFSRSPRGGGKEARLGVLVCEREEERLQVLGPSGIEAGAGGGKEDPHQPRMRGEKRKRGNSKARPLFYRRPGQKRNSGSHSNTGRKGGERREASSAPTFLSEIEGGSIAVTRQGEGEKRSDWSVGQSYSLTSNMNSRTRGKGGDEDATISL